VAADAAARAAGVADMAVAVAAVAAVDTAAVGVTATNEENMGVPVFGGQGCFAYARLRTASSNCSG